MSTTTDFRTTYRVFDCNTRYALLNYSTNATYSYWNSYESGGTSLLSDYKYEATNNSLNAIPIYALYTGEIAVTHIDITYTSPLQYQLWDYNWASNAGDWASNAGQLLKAKLRANLMPKTKTRAIDLRVNDTNEQVALDSLREIVTESDFRKYIKYGFILVKGQNGNVYQVFRNSSHTKVWRAGKVIEEICVRIKDIRVPKTDNVIAFKAMIEADEQEFRKCGNVFKMNHSNVTNQVVQFDNYAVAA